MIWKKLWICAGILAAGMTTCTIRAEVVDMGGFQIQIGQKPDRGMELPEQNHIQKNNGQIQKAEKVPETPQENSRGTFYEKTDTESVQESSPEAPAAEIQEELPEEAEQSVQQEESFYPAAEMTEPSAEWTGEMAYGSGFLEESWRQEEALSSQEEMTAQGQESTAEKGNGGESENIQREMEKEPEQKAGKNTVEKSTKTMEAEQEGKPQKRSPGEKIQFIHDDSPRLKPGTVPFVRLKGKQEVCVISYAVNRRECACRWEKDSLMPVEPVLHKGINCLEISVLSEDGQVISMEPWYFSCGVGRAML